MTAGRGARSLSPRAFAAPWREIALVLGCVAFALWVQRRALGGFFSLDDLVILEEVRGLRDATPGLWRLLSRTLYFGAAVPLFGSNPFPYHLASALLHGVNVALVYGFVRRRAGSVAAATVAAALFGTSRLHATALASAATIGEPLALAFTLAAFLLHDRGRAGRAVAPVVFLCALLSKESVVLLPAVLLLPWSGGPPLGERLRRALPLLAVGVLFAVALAATGATGTHLGGPAYARAFGGNLFFNLMTYAKWVADLGDPFPGQVSAIAREAWPAGLAATACLVLLAVVARGGRLPAWLGAAWWLLALAPVLPLLHHTYLYYLYVPFAGIVMAIAGAVDAAEVALVWRARRAAGERSGGGRPAVPGRPAGRGARCRRAPAAAGAGRSAALAWVAALALVLAHGGTADRMLAARAARRLPGTGIPLDPELRKSEMARHASQAVGRTLGGRPGRVAFLLPADLVQGYSAATGEPRARAAVDSGGYLMLAGALDDGPGLRALHPNVDSVAFLPGWREGYAEFELFGQSPDGRVFALGRGADGFARAAGLLLDGGTPQAARQVLSGGLGEFPDHAPLRYESARWFHVAGDSAAMRRELEELIRRTPAHPLAARARARLAGAGGGN